MAFTKLYLTNATAPYTPATLRGAWDQTAGAVTKALDVTKVANGAPAIISIAETNAAASFDVLLYRGVSGKLASQTISGTLDAIIGVSVSNALGDFVYHVHAFVTQGDTDSLRGTLVTDAVEVLADEWSITPTCQQFSAPKAITSLAISQGDRIVVEIGYSSLEASATSRSGSIYYGCIFAGVVLTDAVDGVTDSPVPFLQAGHLIFSNSIAEDPADLRLTTASFEMWEELPTAMRISTVSMEVWDSPAPAGGGGTPPINPPAADTTPLAPKLFIWLHLPNGNTYTFAETPLNDTGLLPLPIGQYKPAKLMVVSDIERELSSSGYKGSSWSFTIADLEPLREWRNIALTETIEGATAMLYLWDDDVRRAEDQPYRAAAGIVTHHEGVNNSIQYKFDVEDLLGARLTEVAADPKIPSHPLLSSEFPGLDPSQDGIFGPIAIGELVNGNGSMPGRFIATINLLAAFSTVDVDVDVLLHSEFAVSGVDGYYYSMSTWGNEENVTVGWFNRPTPAKATGLFYIVSVAGKTGTSEPVWPTSIGGTVVDGTVTWTAYAVDNLDIRFLIPASAYGSILTASFMPAFNAATGQPNQYVDYPIGIRRYGILTFIRHDFIYARAIREGRMVIAADGRGVTAFEDGSGPYIATHEDAIVWITVNLLFNDSTGIAYGTMPQITDYDIFDNASLIAAKAAAVTALAGGFLAGFMLGRGGGQQSGFTLWQEILEGGDVEIGPNRHGQAMFAREDPAAVAVMQLNELKDLESFNIFTNSADNKNWMQVRYGYRYVQETNPVGAPNPGQPLPREAPVRHPQWESGTQIISDTVAQGLQKRIKRVNFDNYATNDSPTALIVAQRRFARFVGPAASRDGQKTFEVSGGWGMLGSGAVQLDLNSVIGLTHGLGFGPSGFANKTGRITKVRINPQSGRVTYSGPVLYPYISTTVI